MKRILLVFLITISPALYAMESQGKKEWDDVREQNKCLACGHINYLSSTNLGGCHQYICDHCLGDTQGELWYHQETDRYLAGNRCSTCRLAVIYANGIYAVYPDLELKPYTCGMKNEND